MENETLVILCRSCLRTVVIIKVHQPEYLPCHVLKRNHQPEIERSGGIDSFVRDIYNLSSEKAWRFFLPVLF